MYLESSQIDDNNEIDVCIPPVRQDILHPCDILEDIGIGYGYNRMQLSLPDSFTIGQQFLLNKITDQLRNEIARCGFTEIFTFSLVCIFFVLEMVFVLKKKFFFHLVLT